MVICGFTRVINVFYSLLSFLSFFRHCFYDNFTYTVRKKPPLVTSNEKSSLDRDTMGSLFSPSRRRTCVYRKDSKIKENSQQRKSRIVTWRPLWSSCSTFLVQKSRYALIGKFASFWVSLITDKKKKKKNRILYSQKSKNKYNIDLQKEKGRKQNREVPVLHMCHQVGM